MNPELWWYLSRASGLVAWGLASLSVVGGLFLAARVTKKLPTRPWQTDLHTWLGGLTCTFTGIHLGALVADSYVQFDLVDLLVPFASEWRPGAVALGVVALWLLAAVQATSLLRRRISKRAWKRVHLTSYLVWLTGTAHLFTAGTDAGVVLVVLSAVGVAAALFAGTYRLIGPKRPKRPKRPIPKRIPAG